MWSKVLICGFMTSPVPSVSQNLHLTVDVDVNLVKSTAPSQKFRHAIGDASSQGKKARVASAYWTFCAGGGPHQGMSYDPIVGDHGYAYLLPSISVTVATTRPGSNPNLSAVL